MLRGGDVLGGGTAGPDKAAYTGVPNDTKRILRFGNSYK
ncbi:hypothetical protein Mucpa_1088 [Mucilaginibacter paludis DSM 18603]|uniref:Uncharacterized protein n=1 Tax=Mucilaginibacter paludis DSM 18603 TaxID=714943 RepID=H1YF05_9SPHI|nr:hypothetical protein Mucpa_1088 [Mucilaginibacter paludis DSM 18603]